MRHSYLYFYQSKTNHKARIVARETQNQKLRLNQLLLPSHESKLSSAEHGKGLFYSWTGIDQSIINEENLTQDQITPVLFGIKFYEEEEAKKFAEWFTNLSESNRTIDNKREI